MDGVDTTGPLVKERTALKRAASRINGTKFGRPRKVSDADHVATAKRMKADGHTGKDNRQIPRSEPGHVVSVSRRRYSRLTSPLSWRGFSA